MDILQIGTDILKSKLGNQAGAGNDAVSAVLKKLVGNGNDFDIAGLLSGLQTGGLASMASSWLGDGANEGISPNQIKEVLGGDKVAAAASELGTDEQTLLGGLSDALPQMVDKASSGGSLLDSVGGLGGAMDMAKKFF
ncbi:uncharacterized protein DUF937 [Thiogranum longum]|uniref:Uncharacterized protein DUF937 n=1 Tax=Thiogranum longum TaxID=1537524 RepID=A0A4R1HF00_9GAMM|nr:YidB family protein [Thiogranum longum]TCK17939.1 uncharacterized protein DUF937 [Thiogranum longum]